MSFKALVRQSCRLCGSHPGPGAAAAGTIPIPFSSASPTPSPGPRSSSSSSAGQDGQLSALTQTHSSRSKPHCHSSSTRSRSRSRIKPAVVVVGAAAQGRPHPPSALPLNATVAFQDQLRPSRTEPHAFGALSLLRSHRRGGGCDLTTRASRKAHPVGRRPFSATTTTTFAAASSESTPSPSTEAPNSPSHSTPGPKTNNPKFVFYDLFPRTLAAGPPPSGPFDIDLKSLKTEFLRLQAQAHPDLHHRTDAKKDAEAKSALINEAYKTLANPLLRAQYLLSVQGRTGHAHEEGQMTDQELLMDVMDVQERAEEATEQDEIDELLVENEGRMKESSRRLASLFADSDLDGAEVEVVRLKFWDSLGRSLVEWHPGRPLTLVH